MAKRKGTEGQATKWPKEKDRRTSNTMVKRKRTEGQATQWPKERGQKELVLLSLFFGHFVACPSVPVLLAIVLLVLLSLFFWQLCCLSFCPFSVGHHNGQKKMTEGQATQ
jgi:hypothetical protein